MAVRLIVRYTVGRDTEKSSPRSVIVYSPVSCIRLSSRCCSGDSFGWRPRSLPSALATAIPSRVRIRIRSTSNSANVARMLKNIFPIGIVGPTTEREQNTSPGKGVTDVPSIGNRPSKSIQLRHHERVTRSYRGEGLIQPGPLPRGAAHAMVDVDAISINTERE